MDQSDLTYIKVPYPHAQDLSLKIVAPVCSLVISPGIGNAWVTGKYYDPKFVAPLHIKKTEKAAEIVAVGAFVYRTPPKFIPQMKLSFGRGKPFSLTLEAGDFCGRLDFGGLPLSALDIRFGGSSQAIDFSYPNTEVMRRLKIRADVGPIHIENLAHANAEKVRLNGDSTSFQVHFGSELKRSVVLHIGATVSRVEICIPANTAVKITGSNHPPLRPDAGEFSYADKTYWNNLAKDQQEPLLQIHNAASDNVLSIQTI